MCPDFNKELRELESNGQLRNFNPLSQREDVFSTFQGVKMVNLTSNDYLGLGGNRALCRKFYESKNEHNLLDEYGPGSTSSRLLTGDNEISHNLEEKLCGAYQRPAALLFNSGYHANIGILPALMGKKDLILSDKLNHASIHDGIRLSRAEHKRFRHCDYEQLELFLETRRDRYERVMIVSESVFSMDGDVADLPRLVALKKKYGCMLYVDEAHGVGLYGDKGLGKAEEFHVTDDVDLLVGTFGKAYASVGAYVICEQEIYTYLVNHSRSLIFTTALPPVVLSWNSFIFSKSLEMQRERKHLTALSQQLREDLIDKGLKTDGSTNIVPVMIGQNQVAVDLANEMRKEGYLIFPIRPPAVPQGTARFRLSLTANMEWGHLENISTLLAGKYSKAM